MQLHESCHFQLNLGHALARDSNEGVATAKYVDSQSDNPPITKVMMNPPFALKTSKEKEYHFIDQALAQMQHGGILFSVLPYSAMVRPKGYLRWRKTSLLPNNTVLAIVTFPIDLFYPIGITTVGVFIKKGTPHPRKQNVLWIRALGDGLLKSKGKRLPNPKASNELSEVTSLVKAYLHDQNHPVNSVVQFHKACPIDFSDRQLELAPEVYLDQAKPRPAEIFSMLEEDLRAILAYLIKIGKAALRADLLGTPRKRSFGTSRWRIFSITDVVLPSKTGHAT